MNCLALSFGGRQSEEGRTLEHAMRHADGDTTQPSMATLFIAILIGLRIPGPIKDANGIPISKRLSIRQRLGWWDSRIIRPLSCTSTKSTQ